MNERERDDTSVWCYDGMCKQCEDGGCEHHCHHADARTREMSSFAARGVAVVGLGVWAVIGGWTLVPDDWPGMVQVALEGLIFLVVIMLSGDVIRGLVGFKKKEQA